MLNCDYKTISEVITTKIDSFSNFLIENQQNGFMKAKNIGDNIRLVFDIINYANHEKMPGAVILVDLHKAFDSLKWSFIFAMLKCYGFGNSLINWLNSFSNQLLLRPFHSAYNCLHIDKVQVLRLNNI